MENRSTSYEFLKNQGGYDYHWHTKKRSENLFSMGIPHSTEMTGLPVPPGRGHPGKFEGIFTRALSSLRVRPNAR
jgi:hypothetical protein